MVDLHLLACAAAVVAGACAALLPKGCPAHRGAGQLYVVSTVVYCLSSFFIYTSTGQLTFFHAVSVQNLALVSAGMAVPRLVKPSADGAGPNHRRARRANEHSVSNLLGITGAGQDAGQATALREAQRRHRQQRCERL